MLPQSTYSWWSHSAQHEKITPHNFLFLSARLCLLMQAFVKVCMYRRVFVLDVCKCLHISQIRNRSPQITTPVLFLGILLSQRCRKDSSLHKVDSNPHFHLFMDFTRVWKWLSNKMIFSVNSSKKQMNLKLVTFSRKPIILCILSHPMLRPWNIEHLNRMLLKCPLET